MSDVQVTVPQAVALKNVPDVELVAVGAWPARTGNITLTGNDLMQAVAAQRCPAIGAPVLKLGHDEPTPGEDKIRWDGEPAVGWISNMRLSANKAKILGDYTGVPGWLADVMASAYPRRSIEGWQQYHCQVGHTHPFVISAVSLLGVHPAAVGVIKSLNDVQALYTVAAAAGQPDPAILSTIETRLARALPAAEPDELGAPSQRVIIRHGGRILFGRALLARIELHLPGRHDQRSHGNRKHRAPLLNIPGKSGLARLTALAIDDEIEKHVKATDEQIAKKQAQLVKKFKGKPAPKYPQMPNPPHVDEAAYFDGWHAKVVERYDALGTGKPLTQSFNYPAVRTAIEKPGTPEANAAVGALLAEKYLDAKLVKEYDQAVADLTQGRKDALKSADYKKALTTHKRAMTRFKKDTALWREVNGINGNLSGMEGARTFASDDEGIAYGVKNFPAPADPTAKAALQQYTGSDYISWNTALRDAKGGAPKGWESNTDAADSGMTEFTEPVMLVRGTNLDEFAFADGTRTFQAPPPDPTSLIGSVQVQHGYMSTSVGSTPGYGGNQVLMKVKVPEGHKGSYVSGYSGNTGERELLLQRSTQYFIHDVRYEDGRYVVEAEVLPPGITADELAGHPVIPLGK